MSRFQLIRLVVAVVLFAMLAISAFGQLPPPEPPMQALGQMLAEAQQREAVALVRAITAERKLADMDAAAAKARAPAAQLDQAPP